MVKLDLDKVDPGLIPAGAVVQLRTKVLPGNIAPDNVLTRSYKGDCSGLRIEYTVAFGEYAGRKFQAWHTIEGTTPAHADACADTKVLFRTIVDAAYCLDPGDTSPEAVRLRTDIDLAAFFNGAVFRAEVGVEPGRPKPHGGGGNFPDRNTLVRILPFADYDPDDDREREAEIAFYGEEIMAEVFRKREERKRARAAQ